MTQRKNVFLVSSRHISIHHLLHTWNAFHAIVQNVVSSFFCLFWHTEWIRIDKQQIFQVHKAEWTEIVEISRQSTLTHFGMCCVLQSNSIIYKSRSSHSILIPKYIHTHTPYNCCSQNIAYVVYVDPTNHSNSMIFFFCFHLAISSRVHIVKSCQSIRSFTQCMQ